MGVTPTIKLMSTLLLPTYLRASNRRLLSVDCVAPPKISSQGGVQGSTQRLCLRSASLVHFTYAFEKTRQIVKSTFTCSPQLTRAFQLSLPRYTACIRDRRDGDIMNMRSRNRSQAVGLGVKHSPRPIDEPNNMPRPGPEECRARHALPCLGAYWFLMTSGLAGRLAQLAEPTTCMLTEYRGTRDRQVKARRRRSRWLRAFLAELAVDSRLEDWYKHSRVLATWAHRMPPFNVDFQARGQNKRR